MTLSVVAMRAVMGFRGLVRPSTRRKTIGSDGVLAKKALTARPPASQEPGTVVACAVRMRGRGLCRGLGEKILAVFVEAEEEVFNWRLVNGDELGGERRRDRRSRRGGSGRWDSKPRQMRGGAHGVDEECAGIGDGFAFQIGGASGRASNRIDVRFGSAINGGGAPSGGEQFIVDPHTLRGGITSSFLGRTLMSTPVVVEIQSETGAAYQSTRKDLFQSRAPMIVESAS